MKNIFILLFSFLFIYSFSQKEVNIWYFGNKAGLDFNPCTGVAVLNNSQMIAKEGTAVMSDVTGALLFYTNGVIVYNKNHVAMTNGTGLNGGSTSSASQNALIVPDPGNAQRYYVFTADEEENSMSKGVCYSIVDMTLNGGLGDVTTKNTSLIGGGQSVEKLTAYTRPAGGYWVVAHGWGNNRFYVYALTAAGVGTATTTNIGNIQNGLILNAIGPLKFSPDGTKLASCNYFSGSSLSPGYWELFDFNLNTGAITNAKSFSIGEPFGLEFSSNSNVLYITAASAVYQYNISSNVQATIAGTKLKVSNTAYAGPLQLGPDCKIYVSTNSTTLDVINNPNTVGAGCGYAVNAINLGAGNSSNSTPNFQRSYFANMTCTSGSALNVTTTPLTPISCEGGNDGSYSVSATGCNPPYTYTWQTNPVQTGQTATGLQAGTYTVIVSDPNGTTTTTTVSITQPNGITIGSLNTQPAACGQSTGSATVSGVSGGTGSTYTYSWSSGGNGTTESSLAAGNYTLTITDANGCPKDTTFSISSTGGPTITTNAPTNVSCNGGSDGVASVSVSGTGLTYTWSPSGGSNASASNLSEGTYTVTVNDVNLCQSTATVTITEPLTITVTNVSTPASCQGVANGSATVNPSNGTGVYTYSWSTGTTSTNNTLSNVTDGNYSVSITDALGCTATYNFTITQNGTLAAPNTPQAASCQGIDDGSVTVNPTGGTGPYTYSWSNSTTGTANTLTGLATGNYSVVVTDAVGCTTSSPFSISQNGNLLTGSLQLQAASCQGVSDGSVSLTPTGGTGPYSYSWSNSTTGTTNALTGLATGNYTVVVIDASGCTSSTAFSITQNGNLALSVLNDTVNCYGYSDGALTGSPSGGNPGYTYSWSNNQTTQTISGLDAGTYSLTITDTKGCISNATANIAQPTGMITTVSTTAANANTANGTATASVAGGAGSYSYSWIPTNDNTSSISNLSAGLYTLVVEDAKGCMDTTLVLVDEIIPCYDPYVPTAFSPNGDNNNDVLYVRGACINTFTFEVYNRWGERIFTTTDPASGWPGTFRGRPCDPGVYVYKLTYISKAGSEELQNGNITLVR